MSNSIAKGNSSNLCDWNADKVENDVFELGRGEIIRNHCGHSRDWNQRQEENKWN